MKPLPAARPAAAARVDHAPARRRLDARGLPELGHGLRRRPLALRASTGRSRSRGCWRSPARPSSGPAPPTAAGRRRCSTAACCSTTAGRARPARRSRRGWCSACSPTHLDYNLYATRMAANAMRAVAGGLGTMAADDPPPLYAFDPDTERLAVTHAALLDRDRARQPRRVRLRRDRPRPALRPRPARGRDDRRRAAERVRAWSCATPPAARSWPRSTRARRACACCTRRTSARGTRGRTRRRRRPARSTGSSRAAGCSAAGCGSTRATASGRDRIDAAWRVTCSGRCGPWDVELDLPTWGAGAAIDVVRKDGGRVRLAGPGAEPAAAVALRDVRRIELGRPRRRGLRRRPRGRHGPRRARGGRDRAAARRRPTRARRSRSGSSPARRCASWSWRSGSRPAPERGNAGVPPLRERAPSNPLPSPDDPPAVRGRAARSGRPLRLWKRRGHGRRRAGDEGRGRGQRDRPAVRGQRHREHPDRRRGQARREADRPVGRRRRLPRPRQDVLHVHDRDPQRAASRALRLRAAGHHAAGARPGRGRPGDRRGRPDRHREAAGPGSCSPRP